MRVLLLLLASIAVAGCSLIYKLPTRQGNVLEQKQLDQLKTGMTREQVVYLLGTPLAASPFRTERWDYLGYYKSPRGEVSSRTVTLLFAGDSLTSMVGTAPIADSNVAKPSAKDIRNQQKKDSLEAERAKQTTQTGIVIGAPEKGPEPTVEPAPAKNP